MTFAKFKIKFASLGGSLQPGEKFSSLNAWGFDGWFGEKIPGTFGDLSITVESGRIGTRHNGTFPLFRVRVEGIHKPINPEFFIELLVQGLHTVPELLEVCEAWNKTNLARR